MEVIEAIRKRYSCRNYQDKPIDKEKLEQVFEAARLAPSAKNLQDWRFVVVTHKDRKTRVAGAANNQMFLAKAGAIIVACSNCKDTMSCGQPIGPIDVAIALDHITLRATELGLATCWIGSFYPDKIRDIIGIPKNIEVIELMGLGWPADEPAEAKRVSLKRIRCYEKWQF